MRRCLELAKKAEGHVSPNPMVGCVIVHNEKIIGEGYHQKYKSAHDFDKSAEDLRLATRHLGMIVGKVDVEELLGSIFNDFCIGK